MQERLSRAATGPDFAVLQCTMSFCSFTGCGLSDPVTVSNMIWFLGGYCFFLSPRVISLLSFILSFVICSKYTGFQFLFLCKSMSRRLRWLTAAPTWIWLGENSISTGEGAEVRLWHRTLPCWRCVCNSEFLSWPGDSSSSIARQFICNLVCAICILFWYTKGTGLKHKPGNSRTAMENLLSALQIYTAW